MNVSINRDVVARLAAITAAVLASFGAVACGGSDGDAGASSETKPNGTDKQQVIATVRGLFEAMYDLDTDRFCQAMTKRRRSEQSLVQRLNGSCEEVYGERHALLRKARKGQPYQGPRVSPNITKVEIDGDVATATIEQGRRSFDYKLVPEDGRWRVASPKEALERSGL